MPRARQRTGRAVTVKTKQGADERASAAGKLDAAVAKGAEGWGRPLRKVTPKHSPERWDRASHEDVQEKDISGHRNGTRKGPGAGRGPACWRSSEEAHVARAEARGTGGGEGGPGEGAGQVMQGRDKEFGLH